MANRDITATIKAGAVDELLAKTEKLHNLLEQVKQLLSEISGCGLLEPEAP